MPISLAYRLSHFGARPWTFVAWGVALGLATLGTPVGAQPFAYVTNYQSGTVSKIDLLTNETTNASVGTHPVGVAIDSTGTTAYVSNEGSGNVSVVDTPSMTVVATVSVGTNPEGLAVTPDDGRVYSAAGDGIVSVIETATNSVLTTIPVGGNLAGVAINPSGTRVYVAKTAGPLGSVAVINSATDAVVADVLVSSGGSPYGMAINMAATKLYVGLGNAPAVQVIDLATNLLLNSIPVQCTPPAGPLCSGGVTGVAVSPDGTRLYAAVFHDGGVIVIDATSDAGLAGILTGASPQGIDMTPDGARLYVANGLSNTISIVDASSNAVVGTILSLGIEPRAFGRFISAGVPPTTTSTSTVTSTSNSVTTTSNTTTSTNTSTTIPEDTGFIPPDTIAAKCEGAVAKAATKLATAIGRCHQKAALAAFQGAAFDEEACEATAKGKYNGATAKLFAKSACPPCLVTNAPTLRDQLEGTLDQLNGLPYCAGTSPLP